MIIESGGQSIPYDFYFRLLARLFTYRATKSRQQETKVAKSHPAEKTCNFVLCLCILSITWHVLNRGKQRPLRTKDNRIVLRHTH